MSKHKRTILAFFERTLWQTCKRGFVVFGLFAVMLPLFFLTRVNTHVPHAHAATSDTLNFQARLQTSSGAIAPDGYYNVQFKLYDASSGGTLLWTGTYYDSNGVTAGNDNRTRVANGYLTVNLGDIDTFPSTIPWDQQLYVTMNIGGTTQTATPTWDGEMNPRLKLTAVPYAFNAKTASELTKSSGANIATLSILAPTSGNQTFQIQDQGAAGTYNILTAPSGSDGYIKLQGLTPGTQQTGNFNISGTGIASVLQAGTLDASSATALAIGTTNATAINLNQNTTIASGKSLTVTAGASSFTGLGSGTSTAVSVATGATSNVGITISAVASQTADLLQLRDSSGNVNSAFNAAGNQLTLGRIAGSGTVTQGTIVISDGTTSGFGATVQSSTLTADRKFLLPDTALATTASPGTICVFNGASSNCPAATGSTAYIWNSNTVQAASNFYTRSANTTYVGGVIEGANGQTADLLNLNTYNGTTSTTVAKFTAAGNLQVAGSLDTTTATTLTIGGTNATAINLNQSTVLAAGKSITISGGNTASRPGSPTEGMVYYDTTTHQLLTYNNSKWVSDRTDAVIVAASNSSQADKDAADYVADGNTGAANDGDQVQINAALTAAAGTKVVLLAGTYTADATILIPNNTTLTGVGVGTLIQLADIDATDNLIENSDTTTGTGIGIRDLKLDGQQSLQTGTITQYGVYLYHMGNQAAGRVGARISNVYVSDVRDAGIYFDASENNAVTNSTLYSIDAGGTAPVGIYNDSSSNNSFTNNTFLANYWGLRLDGSGTRNTTVTGNIFRGSTSKALLQFGATHSAITGNTFDSNTDALILYTSGDSTVSGNTFYANTGYSITLDDSSSNTITGNRIQNSGDTTDNNAIYVQNSSDSNTIADNTITDSSAATTNYAIRIASAGSDTNYLVNNTLGGGTIYDSGTGTIFAGQIDDSGYIQFKGMTGANIQGVTTINTTGTAATSIGNTTGNLVLQGGSTVSLASSNGANSTTLGFTGSQAAGNITYNLDRTVAAGAYTICTTAVSSCAGTTGPYVALQSTTPGTAQTGNINVDGSILAGYLSASGTIANVNGASLLNVQGQATSATNTQKGAGIDLTVSPTSASSQTYRGIEVYASSSSANVSSATIVASSGYVDYAGTGVNVLSTATGGSFVATNSNTGTIDNANGATVQVINDSTGTINTATGLRVRSGANLGTITDKYGIYVETQTGATNAYGLYINGADDYALYVNSGATYLGGTTTSAGLITGQAGATITGATNINTSGSAATNIGNGSSGTITIGDGSAGAIAIQSGTSIGLTGVTNINTTGTAATSIGNTTGNLVLQGGSTVSLASSNGTNSTTLGFTGSQTAGNIVYELDRTVAAGSYSICTSASGSCAGSYIQNQNASAQTTANFWISGSGQLDGGLTASGGTINLNASSNNTTNINTGTSTGAVNIGTGTGVKTITIGNAINNTAVDIQAGSGTGAITMGTGGNTNFTIDTVGRAIFQATTVDNANFQIKSHDGSVVYYTVDETNGQNKFNGDVCIIGGGGCTQGTNSALTVQGGTFIGAGGSYTRLVTPATSYNLDARLVLDNLNYTTNKAGIALGMLSTSDATARGIIIADARATTDNNPTIGIYSPDENSSAGLGWDGSNTTFKVKTQSLAGATSAIKLTSGNITGGSGATTGAVTIQSGDGNGTNSSSGNVTIDSGTKSGGGTTGVVNVGTTNASAITLGYSGITTTNAGALTVGQLLTANLGATISGATINLNASSNFATNINTGTSTGTVTIGNNSNTNNTVNIAAGTTGGINLQAKTTVTGDLIVSNNTATISGTSTGSYKLSVGGTVNASNTGSQYGIQNEVSFTPTGASLSNIWGTSNVPTVAGSALNIGQVVGTQSGIATTAGYTGQIALASGIQVTAPAIAGSQKILDYRGVSISGNADNGSNTSGTITNAQIRIGGNTTAAGVGGTLNNYGTYMTLSSGSSSGTNNYGLFITGNGGGSANSNYAIYSNSTAASLLSGAFTTSGGIINLNASSNYATNINTGTSNAAVSIGNSANTTNLASRTINHGTVGATNTLQGVAQTAANTTGDQLTIKGSAGLGSGNGGTLLLSGGDAGGTGVLGLVNLNPTAFTGTSQNCTVASCSITAATVNANSTALVNNTYAGSTVTLADPTITTAGRVLYVTNSGTQDMTLSVNGGGAGNTIALKMNTTATMFWNGVDWTAAGASSATDLQAAYNNTQSTAGGAEIVLTAAAGNSEGLTIRNNGTTPITGALFEVQSSIAANLFSVNNNTTEYSVNGGAENSTLTNWTGITATASKNLVLANVATGLASVQVAATGNNQGAKNTLSTTLAASTTYVVSFAAKASSAGPFNFNTYYSIDGTANSVNCNNTLPGTGYTLTNNFAVTNVWTKVSCFITTPASGMNASNAIRILETDMGTATFYIDNLSVISNASTTTPANVQIGGGATGGQPTLFTLDQFAGPPMGSGNAAYYGSMYYDTTMGAIQCYQSTGWGACGNAPDDIVTLTPEYSNAVLNGTGVGTMTADFCGNGGGLSVNTGFCASGEARNYYKWTSPQPSAQTYSVYVTYKLPATFKKFVAGTTTLAGLVDDTTNAGVSYSIYRKASGGGLTSCSASKTVVGSGTGSANTWTNATPTTDPSTCTTFVAGDSIVFQITMSAQSAKAAYVENLNFQYSNK